MYLFQKLYLSVRIQQLFFTGSPIVNTNAVVNSSPNFLYVRIGLCGRYRSLRVSSIYSALELYRVLYRKHFPTQHL